MRLKKGDTLISIDPISSPLDGFIIDMICEGLDSIYGHFEDNDKDEFSYDAIIEGIKKKVIKVKPAKIKDWKNRLK
jgi:hypothetical protein